MLKRFERLLVNREVALLFGGQVVSQAGDSIYQIGLLWFCYLLTGSRSLTGLMASAAYLPYLLLALPGGVLADRLPRRSIMIAADLARLLLVATLPLLHSLGALSILVLGLVTVGVESGAALFYPARDALLPALAPPARLAHANALLQTSWQLAFLIGPALAGVLLPYSGLVHLFSIDALTFLVSLAAVAAIATPRSPSPGARKATAWLDVREGARFAWRDRRMRAILLVTAADNLFLMGPAIVGMVLFVRDVLHLGPDQGAWITACYAGGAIVGAPLMARFAHRAPLGNLLLAGIVLDGLTFLPLFWVRSFAGAAATIAFHSLFIPMITVSRTTLIQRSVPARLQGRMFALVQMAVIGMTALSTFATGLVGEWVPAPTIFLAAAFLAAATALPGFASKALLSRSESGPCSPAATPGRTAAAD
jgi:DHA3 family macrolide efflux protein-like MFS transporter